jgi:hypothetical protein
VQYLNAGRIEAVVFESHWQAATGRGVWSVLRAAPVGMIGGGARRTGHPVAGISHLSFARTAFYALRARLTNCSTLQFMADTITFRPDHDTSNALAVLTRDGTPVSAAVRTALIDAARRKLAASIRAEAEQLAADQGDRAEAAQVLRDMETLRAW